eukprot:CAMPEP_0185783176 /NCGR_PEP_ID=MMETSP1174-20130828/114861_1 /TAXON_ID=35687 /ORGANISM="Dictyocha speculum, Strain CCMP1381" /LENGTH=490 /DNA_ID=CAMNT_0028474075 /DNA_START=26 /DNA_END=1498 /DNA_ORIENTATION=+
MHMIYLTIFLDTLGGTISTPVLPLYAEQFASGYSQIGYLYGIWSFTSTFLSPLLGVMSDKFGRKSVLVASLIGAGTAALAQGLATSYTTLLLARGFSGIWAAVGSTANIYIADVSAPGAMKTYMAQVSQVPALAILFGPSLGGALAIYGLSCPILVDGCINFIAVIFVLTFLVESPIWEAGEHKKEESTDKKTDEEIAAKENVTPVPLSVHVLGMAQLLNGIAFGTMVSMTTIFFNVQFEFSPTTIGFIFMGMGLISVFTGAFLTPRLQNCFSVLPLAYCSTIFNGVFVLLMVLSKNQVWCVAFFIISRIGSSIKGACGGVITSSFTDMSNRGTIFSWIQFYSNLGRLIAPLISGHLAEINVLLPWYVAVTSTFFSAFILMCLRMPSDKDWRHDMKHLFSDVSSANQPLKDEVGTAEDTDALGKYVAGLLRDRHYRWVTHKEYIYQILDEMLPELHNDTGTHHVEDLAHLVEHAKTINQDFGHIGTKQGF